MNNLYDKLLYNWERGFYSVVYSSVNGYGMVTTKTSTGSLWFSGWHNERKVVETRIGLYPLEIKNEGKGIEIVDTVHPSELMGKGFQVGDKVTINLARDSDNGKEGVVESFVNDGTLINVRVRGILLEHIVPTHLKPVLPVEENKNCMKCGVYVSENDIGVIRTETDYLCCLSCDREVNKVIELLKKTKVITDGKIVNF